MQGLDLILIGLLAVIALILIIIIVVLIRGSLRSREDDYDYDDSDEYYDDGDDDYSHSADEYYDDAEEDYDDSDEYYDDEEDYDDSDEYYDDDEEDYDDSDEYDDDGADDYEDDYDEPEEESVKSKPQVRRWKIILENLETWETFELIFCNNVGIGREKGREQFEEYMPVKEDPRVSKVHCAIMMRNDALYLRDMGSRNGTYLNGIRIQEPIVIQKEDIIGVGGTQIEIKKIFRERER